MSLALLLATTLNLCSASRPMLPQARPLPSLHGVRRTSAISAALAPGALPGDDDAFDDEVTPTPAEVRKEIANLALPAIVGTLIDPLLSLIDMTYIGRGLGAVCHGAIGPASELFTLSVALMWAIKDTTATTVSRMVALGETKKAVQFIETTITLAVFIGIILAVVLQATAVSALSLLGAPPASPLHAPALQYVRVRAWALPAVLFTTASEGAFRGLGDTRTPLVASSVAAVVNLVADPLLMFTFALGMRGAAGATALAQCCAAAVYMRRLRRRTAELGQPMRLLTQLERLPQALAEGRRVLRSNAVLLVRTVSILAFWVLCSAFATRLGTAAAAAHFSMINLWLIFVLSAEAPAVAGQVLSARAIAQGRPKYMRVVVPQLARISAAFGSFALVALLALRPLIVTTFTRDAEIAAQIAQLTLPVALSMPVVILAISAESLLIGAGLTPYIALSALAITAVSSAVALGVFAGGSGSVVALWWVIQAMFVLRLGTAAVRIPSVFARAAASQRDRRRAQAGGLARE